MSLIISLTHDGVEYGGFDIASAEFSALPVPEEVKTAAVVNCYQRMLEQTHGAALLRVTGSATAEERDTWPVKAAAAKALIDDTAAPEQAAMLQAEANAKGEDVEDFAESIQQKSIAFHAAIGALSSLFQAAKLRLSDAETAADAQDIYSLVKSQMEAL